MKTHDRSKGSARLRLFCLAALPVIAFVLAVPYFRGAQAANGDSVAVTYSHGAMHVTIPYQSLHPGEGQLEVEVLDPEDQIVGHSEQRVAASEGKGWWQADLKLTKVVAILTKLVSGFRITIELDWKLVPVTVMVVAAEFTGALGGAEFVIVGA